jgi:hypothetical protein
MSRNGFYRELVIAIMLLIVVCGIIIITSSYARENDCDESNGSYPPTIMVNGETYKALKIVGSEYKTEDYVYMGKIESVKYKGYPESDYQANFATVGAKIYRSCWSLLVEYKNDRTNNEYIFCENINTQGGSL